MIFKGENLYGRDSGSIADWHPFNPDPDPAIHSETGPDPHCKFKNVENWGKLLRRTHSILPKPLEKISRAILPVFVLVHTFKEDFSTFFMKQV
jgi:hypothetical protein